jgi:2-oxoglutarate dehydrogenase E2 component (dihydrolipoamide succinyltransferase)
MVIDVTMPQLGESVSEGTISKWRVREGDVVQKDAPLVEIATDKADSELPAPHGGRVVRILAQEGEVVAVKAVLCQIDDSVTATDAPPARPSGVVASKPQASPAPPATTASGIRSATGAPLASPTMRREALERDVNIDEVRGSGDRGRITKDDVARATPPSPAPAPAPLPAPAPRAVPSAPPLSPAP